jgi:hypothetical protein
MSENPTVFMTNNTRFVVESLRQIGINTMYADDHQHDNDHIIRHGEAYIHLIDSCCRESQKVKSILNYMFGLFELLISNGTTYDNISHIMSELYRLSFNNISNGTPWDIDNVIDNIPDECSSQITKNLFIAYTIDKINTFHKYDHGHDYTCYYLDKAYKYCESNMSKLRVREFARLVVYRHRGNLYDNFIVNLAV